MTVVPAPSMVSPCPFKDAGLQYADLIHDINGDPVGVDCNKRWWKQAAGPGAGAGVVTANAVGGGDSSTMATPERGCGKRGSGRLQLVRVCAVLWSIYLCWSGGGGGGLLDVVYFCSCIVYMI